MEYNKLDHEHLNLDPSGRIKGLYTIDHTKAKGRTHGEDDPYWHVITQVIEAYAKIHESEMLMHLIETKQERAMNNNRFAASKSNNMRRLISLPVGLLFDIEAFDPTFFGDKSKVRKFAKRYPGFRTCDII